MQWTMQAAAMSCPPPLPAPACLPKNQQRLFPAPGVAGKHVQRARLHHQDHACRRDNMHSTMQTAGGSPVCSVGITQLPAPGHQRLLPYPKRTLSGAASKTQNFSSSMTCAHARACNAQHARISNPPVQRHWAIEAIKHGRSRARHATRRHGLLAFGTQPACSSRSSPPFTFCTAFRSALLMALMRRYLSSSGC